MKDPYDVLGVPRTASEKEIKDAYHTLAKKYHPDNYKNNPLADLAQEKMVEINEAYDTLTKQRPAGASGGTSSSSYGGGYSSYSGPQSGLYANVRNLIVQGRIEDAHRMLDTISASQRSAEWHFLMGVVLQRKGWLADARGYFEEAIRRDPQNPEYRQAAQMGGFPSGQPGSYGTTCGGGGCDLCTSMICANLLCNCCCNG